MKTTVVWMIAIFLTAAVTGSGGQSNDVYDRVCIHDGAPLYSNPERNVDKTGPTADRWTFAKWLETSEIGTERVRLENGEEWWVERHDFYPVYRVVSDKPAEVLGVYYKDPPADGTKPGGKPDASKVIGHLEPGELVAGNPLAQSFNNTLPIENEAGLSGYVDYDDLELAGEPGWGTADPGSLELYPVEE
ncbi:MAG: hypothetical protein JSW52_00765 [Candidatus Coatesbacteria bacterium]|nr:MAG: hypothetical protein JSW52_00765 [Candidatus Coatesbacteria bacterium]